MLKESWKNVNRCREDLRHRHLKTEKELGENVGTQVADVIGYKRKTLYYTQLQIEAFDVNWSTEL